MSRIMAYDIQYKLEEINNTIGEKYKLEHPMKERDWRTYEQEFSTRIKLAMKDLDPLIHEAVSSIRVIPRSGHPHSLTVKKNYE
jgi:hypothetical protein